jgi:hypothetical protein
MCTGFWSGNLWERDLWGEPDIDGRINFKTDGGLKSSQVSGGETTRKEYIGETQT